jgi:tetratricopeptide (TPR) repeat protein
MYELGRLAQNLGNWPAAESWYKQSHRHWYDGRYWIGEGIVQHAPASLLALRGEVEEAYEGFGQALEAQRRVGDKRGVAATLAQLGLLELSNEQVSEHYFLESRRLQEEAHSIQGQIVAELGLGLLRQGKRKFDASEKTFREARKLCQKIGDNKLLGRTELLLGSLMLAKISAGDELGLLRGKAFSSLQAALEIALRIGDRCTESVAKIRLGRLMRSEFLVDSQLEEEGRLLIDRL